MKEDSKIDQIEISVIIPHYNSFESLLILLNSIPNRKEIEIIVVDDKSDYDDSKIQTINKNVIDRGGVFVRNSTDKKGAGVCRNIGMNMAVGRWLVFADADDYFTENAFDTFLQYSDSESEILYFHAMSVYKGSDKKANRHVFREDILNQYVERHNIRNELQLKYDIACPWAKMIKRELPDKYKLKYSETMVSNDVIFAMKSSYYAEKIEVLPQCVYCVTVSENTLTTTQNSDWWLQRAEILVEHHKFLMDNLNGEHLHIYAPWGAGFLFQTVKRKYGFRIFIDVVKLFRANKITIVSMKAVYARLKYKF